MLLLIGALLPLHSQSLPANTLVATAALPKPAKVYRLAQNNYLVTHNEVRQKIAEGYFTALNLAAIPQDNACITAANAKLWISIDETKLPTNGRMPVWQELVPKAVAPVCTGQNKKLINGVCETGTTTVVDQQPVVKNGVGYCRYTYKVTWSDGSSTQYTEDLKGACLL